MPKKDMISLQQVHNSAGNPQTAHQMLGKLQELRTDVLQYSQYRQEQVGQLGDVKIAKATGTLIQDIDQKIRFLQSQAAPPRMHYRPPQYGRY